MFQYNFIPFVPTQNKHIYFFYCFEAILKAKMLITKLRFLKKREKTRIQKPGVRNQKKKFSKNPHLSFDLAQDVVCVNLRFQSDYLNISLCSQCPRWLKKSVFFSVWVEQATSLRLEI
jgi:hypothetical protein